MALQQHVVVMLCNGSLDLASKGVFKVISQDDSCAVLEINACKCFREEQIDSN